MKKGLQKRIFILFLLYTISIILLLTFFEILVLRYIIFQYEKQNIEASMEKVQEKIFTYEKENEKIFKEISGVIEESKQPNYRKIYRMISSDNKDNYVVIYNSDQELVQGQEWELVDKYRKRIFYEAGRKLRGNFVVSHDSRSFWVDYYSLFKNETQEFFGIAIVTQNFEQVGLGSNYFQVTFPLEESKFPYENFNSFKHKIQNDIDNIKQNILIRTSTKHAYGIKIIHDIADEPQLAICYRYQRNFNEFMQKSLLVSILIIAGVVIVVTVLFGNWFSRQIFVPIKNISKRMQEIIKNPKKIEQIENKYEGELGDMVHIFNEMERSLSQYSHSLENYKMVTENLDSGVFWLDEKMRFVLCNKAMAEILKTKTSQILNKKITEFIKLNKNEIEKGTSSSLLLSNKEIKVFGKTKYVVLNMKAIKENDKLRIIGILADITKEVKNARAMERLELELIKSNKLADIGKKVEGIVHNINSPLNSILGYAQLLRKEIGDNDDLEKIIKAGKNISHQVKELLRKVKENDIGLQRIIDINKLLKQEITFLEHNIYFKHHIKLEMNLADNLPKTTAVYSDISQAIANVMNNAIEAMEQSEEKKIKVKTFSQNDFICVSIIDTGEGIPRQDLENIFEPNYTTKNSDNGSGFGLGLAITRNILDRYKGNIEIQSELGKGSNITLKFPTNRGESE